MIYSSYHPRIVHKIVYKYAQVIYPMLRVVAHSRIIYLHPLDKRGGRICIDTAFVNGFTYICLCVNTMRL